MEGVIESATGDKAMRTQAKIDVGNRYKEEGNEWVKKKEFKKACSSYRKIFGCVSGIISADDAKMSQFVPKGLEISPEEKKIATELLAAAHNNMALCYLKMNEVERALSSASEAVRLSPENAKALLRLGIACTELKQWEKAKAALLKANKLEPDDAVIKKQITLWKEAFAKWSEDQNQKQKDAFGGKLSSS